MSAPWWLPVAGALARRPRLWRRAVKEALLLADPRWWGRLPFLPLPAKDWLAFRMETAYGDRRARPGPEDVVAWLEWADDAKRITRRVLP
jgi:hypothetical protein